MLVICVVLTSVNTFAMAWFLLAYMPARAHADRRMAEILQFNQQEWERQRTRRVK